MRTLALIAIVLLIVSLTEARKKPKKQRKCHGLDGKKYKIGKGYEENCQKFTCRRTKSRKKRPTMVKRKLSNCCKHQDSKNLTNCLPSNVTNQESITVIPDGSRGEIAIPSCVTVGGAKTGVSCAFPFIYNETSYLGCTLDGADDGVPWCPTQIDMDGVYVKGKGQWGHCPPECPTDKFIDKLSGEIDIPSCVTVGGAKAGSSCVFPFTYNETIYRGCTLDGADDGLPWCPTQFDKDELYIKSKGQWGHCPLECPTDQGYFVGSLNETKAGNVNSGLRSGYKCGPSGFEYGNNPNPNMWAGREHIIKDQSWKKWNYNEIKAQRNCWEDGCGSCPNGNCRDFDGRRGMVIEQMTTEKVYCLFTGRRYNTRLTCCSFKFEGNCQNGNGRDYIGTVSKTKDGRTCKKWSTMSSSWGGANHNYCRNPDGDAGVWCFTTTGGWNYCAVPVCTDYDRYACRVYSDANYRGFSTRILPNDEIKNLAGWSFNGQTANDKTSSYRVATGCQIRLYQHSDFRGKWLFSSGNTPSIRSDYNDMVSSVRCDCW